eukprot:jgi/Psemu1/33633/gm1.33633_g
MFDDETVEDIPRKYLEVLCDRKGCDKLATKSCVRCKVTWYCSRECQRKEWKEHKKNCRETVAEEKEEKETFQKHKSFFPYLPNSSHKVVFWMQESLVLFKDVPTRALESTQERLQ